LATCKALVKARARALCLDLNEAGLQSVARLLGQWVIARKVDVSSRRSAPWNSRGLNRPGMFNTAMAADLLEKVSNAIKDRMLLFPNRMGFPEEFAALVCHIIENSYLSATTITIDGGA
jgi:NAD(P)-dependent dehydrogenase (short-subunit alcohol dehydrogenase family)